jgi:ParB family transcriptional regulator, chromosome partitioning protein
LRPQSATRRIRDAELAEIDENLIRCNLTPAKEATAVTRRKAIYLELYPETAHGGNLDGPSGKFCHSDDASFVDATSEAAGKASRTIRLAQKRGEALGDDLRRHRRNIA